MIVIVIVIEMQKRIEVSIIRIRMTLYSQGDGELDQSAIVVRTGSRQNG